MADVSESLVASLDAVDPSTFKDNVASRLAVRAAAERLLSKVETPFERTWRLMFLNPITFASAQTLVDVGVFENWNRAGGGERSLEELQKFSKSDIDINLLRRLMRMLTATYVVDETGENTYKPTPFSCSMGDESTHVPDTMRVSTECLIQAAINLPRYLAKTQYEESLDSKTNSFVDVTSEHLPFFDRFQANSVFQAHFGSLMAGWTKTKIPWTDWYPTKSLLDGADLTKGPLLVDVGGNTGLDISHLLGELPDLPVGSLVLQDLPDVLEGAKVDNKVRKMAHNFFEPQPVTDARVYFFHAVFHDWPDSEAKKILAHIKAAMKPSYSKLFICDIVLPSTAATDWQASMDVQMMALLSASERTEKQFTDLLRDAGFEIIKLWKDPRGVETLIEAQLV